MRYRDMLIAAAENRGATWFLNHVKMLPADVTGLTGNLGTTWLSPIKSLGMLQVSSPLVGRFSLMTMDGEFADRSAMLVRANAGRTMLGPYAYMRHSQRECGKLAIVRPHYSIGTLFYYAPRMQRQLELTPDMLMMRDGDVVRARLSAQSEEIVSGVLENGPITDWIREFLTAHGYASQNIHVLLRHPELRRGVASNLNAGVDALTLYSDGGAMTVASQWTLDAMNANREGQRPIEANAFRMNIWLMGLPPCAEYFINEISIDCGADGQIPVRFADPCVRCDVTRVDPATGDKPDADPLKWLQKNLPPRLAKPSSTTFGFNAVVPREFCGRQLKPGATFKVVSGKE